MRLAEWKLQGVESEGANLFSGGVNGAAGPGMPRHGCTISAEKSPMRVRAAIPVAICSGLWGCAVAADDFASRCPMPSKVVQASCKEITYKDLPSGARGLLEKLKCDVRPGSNYDFGSAVDLNDDGSPEYQFCCHESPHGPCGAVLIGKVGTQWKDLTANGGLFGFDVACYGFVILQTRHAGFHDVCLPIQCSPGTETDSKTCAPTIWQYENGRYSIAATPAK